MERLLSIEDVAETLGLECKTIYRLIRSGELPAARVGRVHRVYRVELEAYLEQQKHRVHEEVIRIQIDTCVASVIPSASSGQALNEAQRSERSGLRPREPSRPMPRSFGVASG